MRCWVDCRRFAENAAIPVELAAGVSAQALKLFPLCLQGRMFPA